MAKILENNCFKLMATELYLFTMENNEEFYKKMNIKHSWKSSDVSEMMALFYRKMTELPEDEKGN